MKIFIKSFSIFLSVCILSSCLCFPGYASSDDLTLDATEVFSSISAQSYLLMDARSGEVLSQCNADVRLPMASTTKIMTCIVALEKCDEKSEVTVDPRAVGIEGSSIYLTAGEKLTLEELLYGLMLESANDAAVAIALHVSQSVEEFAVLMNEKAKELGLSNTNFCNPNGLQNEDHYSTARDLSVLMCYCMQNPRFAEISSTRTKTISAPGGKSRYLANHNKLLRLYGECVAGKTGFTKTAGRCLVTAAEKNGIMLICTTLGAPDDWNDHSFLFDYGFAQFSNQTVLESESVQHSVPIVGGKIGEVLVSNLDSFTLMLREGENVQVSVELPAFVYAPVVGGDILGEAVVTLQGKEIERLALTANEDVEQREIKLSFWQKIWMTIKLWFQGLWKK